MPHSYYFNLYKKFQVLGQVPSNNTHGTGTGGFNLSNPSSVFGSSNRGALLGTTPANSPLWAVLNSGAMGNAAFSNVNVGGVNWPTMPVGNPAGWTDFQISAPAPKLVDSFASWIIAGKVDDIPNGVIATKPATLVNTSAGTDLFVCSVSGDDGNRPGSVPSNYWATSLIYLVDPLTGNTVNPPNLAASSEYHLAAVIGNRGNTNTGRFSSPAGSRVEAAAWVMVWNTGMSPAVQLPSLSNLDDSDTDGTYESYFINAGSYDEAGFRLNVQDVFNGLVAAISDSGTDLGGLSPEEWVHAQGAHLCTKVMVREGNDPWPQLGDTPFTDKRIAQKNMAPFAIDLSVSDNDPDIHWSNFMVGDVIEFLSLARKFNPDFGEHQLTFRPELKIKDMRVFVAVPSRSLHRWQKQLVFKGFKRVDDNDIKRPFPKCEIFELVEDIGTLNVPALDKEFLALSLGVEYSTKQIIKEQVTEIGQVHVEQKTTAPKFDRKKRCYEVEKLSVGGLGLDITAFDPKAKYGKK